MAVIPKTQKKLREAQFFLGWLFREDATTRLDKEDFDFYLSAFLTASRSARQILGKERPPGYEWSELWKEHLRPEESRLIDFMTHQRNMELHNHLGAEIREVIRTVPAAHAFPHSTLYSAYCDEGAQIDEKVHYVEFDGKLERSVDVCRRYLELLIRLVKEFDQIFP